MDCQRCQGRMLREAIHTPRLVTRHASPVTASWWWRCYNCGERVDRAILLARAEQEAESAFLRASADIERKEWAAWFARMPAAHVPTPIVASASD